MKLKMDFTEVLYVGKCLDCSEGYLCIYEGNVYFIFKKRDITAYVTLGVIQSTTNEMYKIKNLKKIRDEFIFDSKYTPRLNNKYPIDFEVSKICNFTILKKDIYNLQLLNSKDKEIIINVSKDNLSLYTFGDVEGIRIELKSMKIKMEKIAVCNLRSFIEIVKSCREGSMQLLETDTLVGMKISQNIFYFFKDNYKSTYKELCNDIDGLFYEAEQISNGKFSFMRLQDLFEDEKYKEMKYPVIKIEKDMKSITIVEGKKMKDDECIYLNKNKLKKYFSLEISQNSEFIINNKALIINDVNTRIIMLRLDTSNNIEK